MSNKNTHSAQPPRGPMGAVMTGEKAKNGYKALGDLIKFIRPFYIPIILAICIAVVGTVLTIIGPDKISDMTNVIQLGIFGSINMSEVFDIGISLIIIYALAFIFSYIQTFIMATVSQRITKSLRTQISTKINLLPLKYYDNTTFGDVLSRVTNDVDTIGNTLSQSFVTIITNITLLGGSLIMMFVTNWIMAITAIAASLIGFVLMMVIMSHSQKYFLAQQNTLGSLNGHIEEIYAGHNVVKAYNGEVEALEKFGGLNNKLYTSAWKSQFFSGLMMPIMQFIGNFGYVAVCVVGGVLAFSDKIEFGVIIAFTLYVRLFTQPLSQLAQAATSMQSAAAASERVFKFLGEEELEDESKITNKLETVKGHVKFENVRFGYSPEKIIIKDFSADIKAGQKIAIVGPTGAGKTTLVNLLMKFYPLNGGEIYIDETPLSQLTRENIHDLFGMVLQDTWLFEGSVAENVSYSKINTPRDGIIQACKAVGIDHFIQTLPNGYDAILDDKANLSQGQKQLITIARAMVENAPMLILDEATSSVDTRTEILIQQAMDKLMQGRTSFVIAHRLSTIKNADIILVMKDGDIIEQGSHDELIERKGFYSDLYKSQFENAEE